MSLKMCIFEIVKHNCHLVVKTLTFPTKIHQLFNTLVCIDNKTEVAWTGKPFSQFSASYKHGQQTSTMQQKAFLPSTLSEISLLCVLLKQIDRIDVAILLFWFCVR